jgi:hypothetical protein
MCLVDEKNPSKKESFLSFGKPDNSKVKSANANKEASVKGKPPVNQQISGSSLDSVESYKRRAAFLEKLSKKADNEMHEISREFEKKRIHFNYEISDVESEMYYLKQDIKKLRHLMNNLLVSLESFAGKDQVEKLEELNNNIDMANYITEDEFNELIDILGN